MSGDTSQHGVSDWPWDQVLEALRHYGPEIGTLAKRGDALAKKVRERYQYAYDHPGDMQANRLLREAFNEYLQRDLLSSERRELGSRFGHLLEEQPVSTDSRIVVPSRYRAH